MTWESDITVQVVRFFGIYGRLAGFVLFMPIFGASPVPMMWRFILPGALTILLAPVIPDSWGRELVVGVLSMPTLAVILLREMALGATAAFLVHLLLDTWLLAGEFIGMDMGMTFGQQVDPRLEQETTLLGSLFSLVGLLLLLALNVHLDIIRLGAASFSSIPAGGFVLGPDIEELLISQTSLLFESALRLALPVFAVIALAHLVLASIARMCQEFEVMMMAFPLQIGLGLLVIGLSLPAMVACNRELTASLLGNLHGLVSH